MLLLNLTNRINLISHLSGPSPRDNHIIETECITYLNECFNRLYNDNVKSLVDNDSYKQVKDLIIRNICTALKQPGLYESQNLNVQIIELFKSCQYSVGK